MTMRCKRTALSMQTLFGILGILFLGESPSAAQPVTRQPTEIKVTVHVDIPQVLRLWGSAAATTQLGIADEIAKNLGPRFTYWTFTPISFDPGQVPRYGLRFRVWAENVQKKPCRDGIDKRCSYLQELTLYVDSKESERKSRVWCKAGELECSDKVRLGSDGTRRVLAESFVTMVESYQDLPKLLGRIPIAERVHLNEKGGKIWAVLPLSISNYSDLVLSDDVGIKIDCRKAAKRLTLSGPVFDEEEPYKPSPPNTGLALLLKSVQDIEGQRAIDGRALNEARTYDRRALIYYKQIFKTPAGYAE